MLFSEFANVLYKHCSGTLSEDTFLLEIFDNIIRDPSNPDEQLLFDNGELNPFNKLQTDTLERYVRGNLTISKRNAKKVITYKSADKFAQYIENLSWDNQLAIHEEFKNMLPNFNQDDNLGYACADLFIKILNDIFEDNEHSYRENVQQLGQENIDKKLASYPTTSIYYDSESGKLHIEEIEINIPKEIEPPDTVVPEELTYVKELLCAYSDSMETDGLKVSDVESLPLKYKRNFSDQRINYYSAKRIEKFVIDSFQDGDRHVEIWKDDTFSYIQDTLWDDYDDGYKRLVSVMQKVVDCSTRSIVDSLHNLLGPKEKKGVCHLLVIDGEIKWVDELD